MFKVIYNIRQQLLSFKAIIWFILDFFINTFLKNKVPKKTRIFDADFLGIRIAFGVLKKN